MGADIRLAESLLAAQPGYVPMRPNGCPIFRGSQFQSRMNGGQTMAMENYLDGASFGSAIDHNNTQERSVPFDSVQETKIVTDNFSAQYGRTSGGFVAYTTKSGTSAFHGGAYNYYNYQGLNATGELIKQKTPTRNENWGFTIGGPVVHPQSVRRPEAPNLLLRRLRPASLRSRHLAQFRQYRPSHLVSCREIFPVLSF